jgi:hypothetical protein
LNDIVAIRKNVDSDVVKNAYVDMDKVAASRINRKRVVETGKFPTVQIASGSKTTNLYKYGRTVKISYEAQRRMQINELQLALNMIAFQWESDMIDDAANVLLTGASNSDVASMGTLAYTDMLNLDLNYDKPFAPTVYIANSTGLGKIFSISQFQDSRLFDTAKTGQWPAPFGRKLRRWDNTDLNKKLLTADARFALRQLTEKGSIIQEANKVIDGQWDAIAISLVRGWDLMFGGSRRTLTYSS